MKRTSASVGHQKADWEVAVHVRIGLSVLCMPHGVRVTVCGERDRCCPIRHPSIALRSGPRLVIFFLLPAQSPALPRRDGWRATPRSVTRQTLLRHRSASLVVATSSSRRATMHGAAQTFRRAMVICAVKNVSFRNKKQPMLDLKLVHRKC